MTSFPEPLVARVVGIQKARIASIRRSKLSRDADWQLEKSVVAYTSGGLDRLLAELGLSGRVYTWPEQSGGECPAGADAPQIEASAGQGEALETEIPPEKIAVITAAALAAGVERVLEIRAANELVHLTVTRISRNPSIVYAVGDAGAEVSVRVASNVNFLAGMGLTARPPSAGSTLYYLEGRCPRWRGRW